MVRHARLRPFPASITSFILLVGLIFGLCLVVTAVFPVGASANAYAPVAAYSFDEGEGTTVEDVTGDGHTGTIEGAEWVRGKYGDGLKFDGAGDVVKIPESSELDLTEEFTLETWVRPESEPGEWSPVIVKALGGTEGIEHFAYWLYDGDWEPHVPWGGTEPEAGELTGAAAHEPIPVDAWTQLTFTCDGARARLYVDGELAGSGNCAGPPPTGGDLELGGATEGNAFFDGRLDEVRIYDRALTAAEVDADMETPIETPKQGPVAAYSFDEGEGTTVEDLTGDGHTGTIEGAEWTRGRYGDGLKFDGEGDVVKIPESPELDLTEEFTLETWVRPESEPGEWSPVITKALGGTEGLEHFAYWLYDGDWEPHVPWGGTEPEAGELTGAAAHEPLPVDAWSELTFVCDGARARLYVDGELAGSGNCAGPPPTGGDLELGGATEGNAFFDGRLDEVRIYERALTAAEVDADMETPIRTPKQGPVAAYSFDEGEGTTVEDLTGDGHEGTIEAPATWDTHGRFGGAMEFGGNEGGCVTVPDAPALDPTEEFTVEAWVKSRYLGNEPVVYKEAEGSTGYALGIGLSEFGRAEAWVDGEGAQWEVVSPKAVELNVWTHLALTYDGARLRLYVDGEDVATKAAPGPVLTGEGPLDIGCAPHLGDTFLGEIDEVRIYGRALSGGEVQGDMGTPLETPVQGPVAEWSFDDGNEETAADHSGNGHEGTIEGGAKPAPGKYGEGLHFDGETGCVSVEATPELQATEEFTAEAWVRPDHAETEAQPVITLEDPTAAEGEEAFAYELLGGGEEEPKAWARKDGEGGYDGVYASAPLEADVWAHLALTDDGAHLRLYVDGELAATAAAPGHLGAAAGPLTIGCEEFGGHFEGRIDEVHVYNRALSGGEVDVSMETPIETPKQGPVAAYSFDEGEGTTVEDLTGDGHTATIEGATWTTHGRYGGAMEFDGENDVLKIPDSPELDFTEEFTLEAWVRPSEAREWSPVIDKIIGDGESPHALSYWLFAGGASAGHPDAGLEYAAHEGYSVGYECLPDDAWSHLALTWDGGKLRLYVDGEKVSETSAPKPPVTTGGDLEIGGSTELGDYFKGRIDEVRVYDRALTDEEVKQTMNSTFPSVDTEATSEVESEDAMMFGTVQVNGTGTEYYFEYGPTMSYGEIANGEELLGNGETTEVEQTAIELTPETTYHYRLVVEGPFGTSYGKDKTFATGPAEEEPPAPLAKGSKAGEFFGINWDGSHENMASPPTGRNDFKRIEESGAKYVRFSVYPGPDLEESFEQARKHNLKVIPYIGEGNVPSGGERTQIINTAKEMVAKFGPGTESDTRIWEVGNEPNLIVPGATLEQELKKIENFAKYYEEVVNEIRTVRPSTEFLLPGLFGYRKTEAHLSVRQYLKKLLSALASSETPLERPYAGVSIHPYVFRVRDPKDPNRGSHRPSSSNPEDAVQLAKEVQRTVAGIHSLVKKQGTPIWVTELGFPLASNNSKFPPVSSPQEQATLVGQTFSRLLEKRHKLNIEHALYYNIQTYGSEGYWYQRCGLFDAARHPYPAWSKFMEVVENE